jgi:hypothetical protein
MHEISDDDEFLVIACDGALPLTPEHNIIAAGLTRARHLGLPVVTSCRRVCP